MRFSRGGQEHQEAVARRLALLSAELAAVRASLGEPAGPPEAVQPPRATDQPAHAEACPPPVAPPSVTPPPVAPPSVTPPLPLLPPEQPGRHAHRAVQGPDQQEAPRRRTRFGGLLVETAPGRLALGPAQLGVLALLVVVALGITAWASLRARPQAEPAGPPSPSAAALATPGAADGAPTEGPGPSSAAVSPATGGTQPAGGAQDAQLVVDVAGRVRRPGIAVLDPGSRVIDALQAAGGARPGVDLSTLNLARPLVDGEQLLVGVPPPRGLATAAVPSGAPDAEGPLVNVNLAGQAELETLPGVGPVTAEAILEWREQHGGFTAVEELLEVDGIGEVTLGQLVPHVTV